MEPKKTVYLGDGLYAECDGKRIRLMATNSVTPNNEVFMEDWVFKAFLNFAGSIGWLTGDGQAKKEGE